MGKKAKSKQQQQPKDVKEQTPVEEDLAEIAAVPGFFGHVVRPGKSLVWLNEVEEFCLQLNSAALGGKVTTGRSTLSVTAKEAKTALCTLIPEKVEQWNLTHVFTSFDGPVEFHNDGVNDIHLAGFIDVQEEDDDEMMGGCGEDCEEDHDHGDSDDSDDSDDDEMAGTYSDSDDSGDMMVFGADGEDESDEDEDDDEEEEGQEGRFEVIEERVHGEEKATPVKKDATPKKDTTPAKKEATPAKKKEATPQKTEAKKSPAKADDTSAKSPAKEAAPTKKSPAKEAKKEVSEQKKKAIADKVAEATAAGANPKKRPAPTEAVDVPKKAKSSRLYKGVTIEEHAVGKGQPIAKGRKASIIYRGRLENGKQFDAQQNRKKPFVFRHGIGDVIKGMDIGIEGMRVGGKRTITIPAHLGYGRSGAPPTIPGNATLVFDIELV